MGRGGEAQAALRSTHAHAHSPAWFSPLCSVTCTHKNTHTLAHMQVAAACHLTDASEGSDEDVVDMLEWELYSQLQVGECWGGL